VPLSTILIPALCTSVSEDYGFENKNLGLRTMTGFGIIRFQAKIFYIIDRSDNA